MKPEIAARNTELNGANSTEMRWLGYACGGAKGQAVTFSTACAAFRIVS